MVNQFCAPQARIAAAKARKAAMEETEDASSPSKTDDVAVLVGTEEQDMVTLQSWCLCALTDIVYA